MLSELEKIVDRYVDRPCDITPMSAVPDRDRLRIGPAVAQVEATALSIDIRQFTGMTNALGRQVMVKMLKAFFEGSVALVSANQGVVADFNGDGMITLFTGSDRTERAFLTASQIGWFIDESLRPKFARFFERVGVPFRRIDQFDAGCGIDDGLVLIARVGTEAFSDIAWVGRCVNSAAKLCKAADATKATIVTHEVYERLDSAPFAHEVKWLPAEDVEVGGVRRTTAATSYRCAPSTAESGRSRMD